MFLIIFSLTVFTADIDNLSSDLAEDLLRGAQQVSISTPNPLTLHVQISRSNIIGNYNYTITQVVNPQPSSWGTDLIHFLTEGISLNTSFHELGWQVRLATSNGEKVMIRFDNQSCLKAIKETINYARLIGWSG